MLEIREMATPDVRRLPRISKSVRAIPKFHRPMLLRAERTPAQSTSSGNVRFRAAVVTSHVIAQVW